MCNVCGALLLIKGETLKVKSKRTKDEYEIRGTSEKAEFKPCKYSLRKNNLEWTEDFYATDLAGIVAKGGFEIKNKCRSTMNDEFLEQHFKNLHVQKF